MAHDPQIPPSDTCQHEYQVEYWHENKDCGLDDCAVAECSDCGLIATECMED
jgi:hypothetical protein